MGNVVIFVQFYIPWITLKTKEKRYDNPLSEIYFSHSICRAEHIGCEFQNS